MELKSLLPGHEELRQIIYPLLGWGIGESPKPCLVAIDGSMGTGKSHLANWLAWQFGAVAVHTDLYWHSSPLKREDVREADLLSTIKGRLSRNRLVIVEGTYCFKFLDDLKLNPDFKVVIAKNNMDSNDCFAEYKTSNPSLFSQVNHTLLPYQES
ncbi:hypothetical protein [Asticcacaulis taihuensis]|uniref:hypothetical protein n=1 Tax=Asticcacaulis taihuensis TaxID=260084 RepID=UPI0026ED97BB|nr:hypothetical protein [Asticcacaulis taihuensis]